ncbi:uncharacterized protein LOC108735431 [Agrilus planipennis]|uniref:Uncharacterized protein LOC108735431 n=1 Tax=Agrilus planipennis TaxID=224129 RepID=A0A1W4WG10_AGRPL|nr:uncharacterized protein LOC108735431 [Agrilus planipennis]
MKSCIAFFLYGIIFHARAQIETTPLPNNDSIIPLEGQPIYNKTFSEYNHPYLLNIRYDIIEGNVTTLLNEITLGNVYCTNTFMNCFNLSIYDVISLINLTDYTNAEIAEALSTLDLNISNPNDLINSYNLTWNKFGDFIHYIDTTVSEIYNSFVNILSSPNQKMPVILDLVQINRNEFSSIFLFGTEEEKLDLLSNGTYSIEIFNQILEIANLTDAQLLSIVPLQKMARAIVDRKFSYRGILDFIRTLEVTSNDLEKFYLALNVTLDELYSNELYQQSLRQLLRMLNKQQVIGTAISQHQLITSAASVDVFSADFIRFLNGNVGQYFTLQAHLVENDSEIVPLFSDAVVPEILSKEIALYDLKYPLALFTKVSLNYNGSEWINCTYLSQLENGSLYQEQLDVQLGTSYLLSKKTNATVYVLGSPVFCDDKIHGLAIEEDEAMLKFTPMLPDVVEPPHLIPIRDSATKSMPTYITTLIVAFTGFKHFYPLI